MHMTDRAPHTQAELILALTRSKQDVAAFFAGIDKLASAKSLSEAAQIQSEAVRAQGEVLVSRAKAYLSSLRLPRPLSVALGRCL